MSYGPAPKPSPVQQGPAGSGPLVARSGLQAPDKPTDFRDS
jgi:hypothetical protein